MPDRGAPSTGRLLRARSRARLGLLASTAATIAVAVATVCALVTGLQRAIAAAGTPAPPGVPADLVAEQVAQGTTALLSAVPALLLLVAIVAATATAQLGRLLASAREHEWQTARARGMSRRQGWVTDAAEAAGAGLVGGAAGLGVALAAMWLAGASPETGVGPAQALAAAATAVLLALVLTVSLRRATERRRAGRSVRATTGALVVALMLGAAFVVWQLPQASPSGFDPIVAVAPAVLLLAAAVVALAAFGALAALTPASAARSRTVAPGYPSRQVARRIPIYAVAVLLVALAVAQTVFASAFAATWTAAVTDSAAVRAGADLRVDLSPLAADTGTVATARAVPGVDAAAPALVAGVEFGDTEAELVAVPADMIDTVVTGAGGFVDTTALAQALAPGDETVVADAVPLGAEATGLSVTVVADSDAPGIREALAVRAIVVDATGTSAELQLEGDVSGGDAGTSTLTARADLPAGTAPWSLLSISALIGPSHSSGLVLVEATAVEALGADELDVTGEGALSRDAREAVLWVADGGVTAGVEPQLDGDAADAAESALPPVRAAVSSTLAERLGLAVGDRIDFRYSGTGRRGAIEVGAIDPAVPGASTSLAVFAPLEILQVSQLQRGTSIIPASSVWASGDVGADDALSEALGGLPVMTSAPGVSDQVVGALVPGWWIATAGSVLLSLIAAFAIVQTLALSRRRELGVLRALGLTPAAQSRMRAAELAAVFGAAVVFGAAAGVLVSWFAVPEFAHAVTPGILPLATDASFAVPGLMIAIAVLVAGLALVVGLATAGVRRAARSALVGEEAR